MVLAAYGCHVVCVRLLIEAGVDLDFVTERYSGCIIYPTYIFSQYADLGWQRAAVPIARCRLVGRGRHWQPLRRCRWHVPCA